VQIKESIMTISWLCSLLSLWWSGLRALLFLLQPLITWPDIYGRPTAWTWPLTTVGCWLEAVAAALAMSNSKPQQDFLLFLLRGEAIAIGFCPVQVGLHFSCCFVALLVGQNIEFLFAVTCDAAFGDAHKTCQGDQGVAGSAGFLGIQSGLLAAAAKLCRFLLSGPQHATFLGCSNLVWPLVIKWCGIFLVG
jgi:hypothetical protein